MKRFAFVSLLASVAVFAALSASATVVPPFTPTPGIAPTVLGSLPAGSLVVSTGPIPYSFGTFANPNKNQGFLIENVYRDSSGFLFFVFQIQVTKGDIKTISVGDWDNTIKIDAEQFSAGGTTKPTGVDRNGFGTVGINFYLPLVFQGKTSYDVILYTNAKGYMPGGIGLIDSGSSPTQPGFVAAAPEPAAFSLLGFGVIAIGTFRKRLFA